MKKLIILIIIVLLILPLATSRSITVSGEKFFGCNLISEQYEQYQNEKGIKTNNQIVAAGLDYLIDDENPDYDYACMFSENKTECKSCVANVVLQEKKNNLKSEERKIKSERNSKITSGVLIALILISSILLYKSIKNGKLKHRKLWITLLSIGLSICVLLFILRLIAIALFSTNLN
jgi:hypothetical protein